MIFGLGSLAFSFRQSKFKQRIISKSFIIVGSISWKVLKKQLGIDCCLIGVKVEVHKNSSIRFCPQQHWSWQQVKNTLKIEMFTLPVEVTNLIKGTYFFSM